MTILDTIIKDKTREMAKTRLVRPLAALEEMLERREPVRDFTAALAGERISLIAEIKKASPSRGLLRPDLDPVQLAQVYSRNGAAAISVLTEAKHFRGSLAHLAAVKKAVAIPVLRKDFIFDPYQVYESAAFGADAILLIAAVLDDAHLPDLMALAGSLEMACLVETHDAAEIERAVRAGAGIIGINNRDLATFEVAIETTGRLRHLVPDGILVVSESGIHHRADMDRMRDYAVDAVLVGESLVTAGDIPGKIRGLLS